MCECESIININDNNIKMPIGHLETLYPAGYFLNRKVHTFFNSSFTCTV